MNKSPPNSTQPASESVDGRDKSFCWYSLRGDPCPYITCKHIHLPHDHLDKMIQAKVSEGNTLSVEEASLIKNELIWKLSLAFRKTRLCYKYQINACERGAECIFAHAKGGDAKEMLGKPPHTKRTC